LINEEPSNIGVAVCPSDRHARALTRAG